MIAIFLVEEKLKFKSTIKVNVAVVERWPDGESLV